MAGMFYTYVCISQSHNSSKVTSVGLGLQYLHYNSIFNTCQEKG